jgi:hypothetical protein
MVRPRVRVRAARHGKVRRAVSDPEYERHSAVRRPVAAASGDLEVVFENGFPFSLRGLQGHSANNPLFHIPEESNTPVQRKLAS